MDYHILDSCLVRMVAAAHSTSDAKSSTSPPKGVLPARDDEIDDLRNALRNVGSTENETIVELNGKLRLAEGAARLAGETPARLAASLAGAREEIKELIWEHEKLRADHLGCEIYLNQLTMQNVTLRGERHNQFQIHSENEELKQDVENLKARLKHEDGEVLRLYNKLDDVQRELNASRETETAVIGLLLDRRSPPVGPKDQEERQAYVEHVAKDFRIAFAKLDDSSAELDSEQEEMAEDDGDETADVAVAAARGAGSGSRNADSSIENADAGPAVDLETSIALRPFKRPSPAGDDGDQDNSGVRGRKRVRAGEEPE
ncbi:hypothetical protein B0A48_15426 [Cryoendolithus antarcticus]|uniref:Uncharacterized protein n=1 Tax=Cryoendolithus antarcticus TaxID=1507870 RepID=A0A1V8SIG8_9PEZI|nr:hypothetical protein B0A48_15426 [Cryoendolithus antarcticus]